MIFTQHSVRTTTRHCTGHLWH